MRPLQTPLCVLEPQCAEHAEAMFGVLADPAIYEFENTPPASLEALRERFRRLESRVSPDGTERWLNWVLRLPSGELAGYVQASVDSAACATVGYELASRFWRRGLCSAALLAMQAELVERYAVRVAMAVLKAGNFRSRGLLEHLGYVPGFPRGLPAADIEDDEIVRHRWLLEPA